MSTMEETLRDNMAKMDYFKSADTSADVEKVEKEVPAASDESESPKPAKGRDDSGKFAKNEIKVADESPADETQTDSAPVEAKTKSYVPKWNRGALEKWSGLPPDVQEQIEKRDSDFHKGIEQYKTNAEQAKEWDKVVSPYMATIQSFGVSPQAAAQRLFAADHTLRTGSQQQKSDMFQKLARDYGVSLTETETPANTPVDSNLSALQQQVAELQSHLRNQQTQVQAQEANQLNSTIQQFAVNKEYFDALRPHMVALLQSGAADTLETAYDLAYQAHPVTKPLWIAKQQDQWKAENAKKAAEARKAAAVNVPQRGIQAPGAKPTPFDETLRNNIREFGLG